MDEKITYMPIDNKREMEIIKNSLFQLVEKAQITDSTFKLIQEMMDLLKEKQDQHDQQIKLLFKLVRQGDNKCS